MIEEEISRQGVPGPDKPPGWQRTQDVVNYVSEIIAKEPLEEMPSPETIRKRVTIMLKDIAAGRN